MRVEELFELLKREFLKVNLLQACLDSMLFFLAGNLLLFLFSLDLVSSIDNKTVLVAASATFFLGNFIYRSRKYNIEIYEEKNPELQEILRTARDNLESHNIVSQALFDELMDRSRKVTSESIIPSTRIIQKIFLVGVLSFLTVLSGLTDFQIAQNDKEILEDLGPLEDVIDGEDTNEDLDVRNGTEILGEKEEIKISSQLVNYNITGSGSDSDSNLDQTPSGSEDAVLDASGPELTDDLELAKQYSLEIKAEN